MTSAFVPTSKAWGLAMAVGADELQVLWRIVGRVTVLVLQLEGQRLAVPFADVADRARISVSLRDLSFLRDAFHRQSRQELRFGERSAVGMLARARAELPGRLFWVVFELSLAGLAYSFQPR